MKNDRHRVNREKRMEPIHMYKKVTRRYRAGWSHLYQRFLTVAV